MKLKAIKEVRFKTFSGHVENSEIGKIYDFEDDRCEALVKLGYFEKIKEVANSKSSKVETQEKKLNYMNKTELTELAISLGIDVDNKTNKEIIKLIDDHNRKS